jgi:D-sedoheptulose 7-phosphate isomerase
MRERALRRLELHAEMVRALVDEALAESIERVAALIAERYRAGATLLLFGNGGSAADAQHIATELTGRYLLDRPPLAALALADNTAALTAIGNDFGFDEVFARQLRAFGRPGDVAVGLSTSGGSGNVLAGLTTARESGLATIGITGPHGDAMAALCDHCIRIPAEQTPQIQEGTMLVLHTICELVEHDLFAE